MTEQDLLAVITGVFLHHKFCVHAGAVDQETVRTIYHRVQGWGDLVQQAVDHRARADRKAKRAHNEIRARKALEKAVMEHWHPGVVAAILKRAKEILEHETGS